MQPALDELISILDLEELELNLFRGRSPKGDRQRVYGGQVAGQALVAACRTVEGRAVHSLHALFLRPGDTEVPIIYQVDRIREGRSFATRRVTAVQHGAPIFALSASFQRPEEGLEHADAMPEVAGPETIPPFRERAARFIDRVPENRREWLERDRPIDTRPVDGTDFFTRGVREPSSRIWIRADGKLPDDPALHQCVAAYASDLTLLDTAARPHEISFLDDDVQVASLDHAMWFHRPFRADEWLLYDQESPSMAGARAFTRARLFSRDGRLVASVAQEGLLRIRR